MSPPRFYLPQFSKSSRFHIEGAEARHALSVLRLVKGDRVTLFDGRGGEGVAKIVSVDRAEMELELIERTDTDRELPYSLELAIALPKGDRQRTLIDAATELGVSRLLPLRTRRSVAQPTENALERLRRGVIEASKQSGRNRLMEIAIPWTVNELADRIDPHGRLLLVAHPQSASGPRTTLRAALDDHPRAATLVIGPEGGLMLAEVELLEQRGWKIVDLGKTILRVEIAAIVAVALIASWMNCIGEGDNHAIDFG